MIGCRAAGAGILAARHGVGGGVGGGSLKCLLGVVVLRGIFCGEDLVSLSFQCQSSG